MFYKGLLLILSREMVQSEPEYSADFSLVCMGPGSAGVSPAALGPVSRRERFGWLDACASCNAMRLPLRTSERAPAAPQGPTSRHPFSGHETLDDQNGISNVRCLNSFSGKVRGEF
jgi:hypothetical protein